MGDRLLSPTPLIPSSASATPSPPVDFYDSDIERWGGRGGGASANDDADDGGVGVGFLRGFSPDLKGYKRRFSVSLSAVADSVSRVTSRVRRGGSGNGGGAVLMMNRKGGGRGGNQRRSSAPPLTVSFIDALDAMLSLSDSVMPLPAFLQRVSASLLTLPVIGGRRVSLLLDRLWRIAPDAVFGYLQLLHAALQVLFSKERLNHSSSVAAEHLFSFLSGCASIFVQRNQWPILSKLTVDARALASQARAHVLRYHLARGCWFFLMQVKEEFESRVAPHLGGDAFHQYLSLLFARLGGTVAWVQNVDGHISRNRDIQIFTSANAHHEFLAIASVAYPYTLYRNINIRVGNEVRQVHSALLREEQALFSLHPAFYQAFKASFDFIDILLALGSTISGLSPPHRQGALLTWLRGPTAKLPQLLLLPWGSSSSGASLLLRAIPQRCRVISTHSHAPLLLSFEAVRAENGWDSATLPYLAHEVQGIHNRQRQNLRQSDTDGLCDAAVAENLASDAPDVSVADDGGAAIMLWGHLPSWHVEAFILKTGDDLRQEELAMQLLRVCAGAFAVEGLGVKMFVYDIVAVAPQAGLIQVVPDAYSIDALKKMHGAQTLSQVFAARFADADSARKAFVSSMAAYSCCCLVLNIKDRHNGNILVDALGHVIHIDFGFFLGNSPGAICFEKAAFKLSQEMVDLMGGSDSASFAEFEDLCVLSFLAVRKAARQLLAVVQLALRCSPALPCLCNGEATIDDMRARLHLQGSDQQAAQHMRAALQASANSFYTRQYDAFQKITNNIL